MGCSKSKFFREENYSYKTDKNVYDILISPNSKTLAIGYGYNKIKLIDNDRMIAIADLDGWVYNPYTRTKIDIAFSHDSKLFVYNHISSAELTNVKLFDIESRKVTKSFCCPAQWWTASFSYGLTYLAIGTSENIIYMYNIDKEP